MRRHFSREILILGLSIFPVLVSGQEKSGWQTAVDAFEAKGARLLLPVHQLLLSELESAARQAEAAGDPKQKAELEATVTTARRDHTKLKDGRVPHADPAEAEKDAFLRAANGTQWALVGTRNLKRIGVTAGTLHSFSEDGRDLSELSRQHVLPGMFGNRRNEGDGWSYYLISPALDLAHAVVTSQISEGVLIERENLPLPQMVPPPAPIAAPVVPPKPAKEDLHVLLERKYRQQLLGHERKLIRLLEDRLKEATSTDHAGIVARLAQAQVALQQATAGDMPAPPLETITTFHARLEGCAWRIPRLRIGQRLIVTQQKIQTIGVHGELVDSMPAETLWPGVMRARAPDGTLLMAVFSPDLNRLLTFPVRSQFVARRVE